jgi:TolA-binding protein
MKKRIATVFLFLCLAVAASAQSSATVDSWLSQTLDKSNRMLSLARENPRANADAIAQLWEEILDLVLRVENYQNQGNSFTADQINKMGQIGANGYEVKRRMEFGGVR